MNALPDCDALYLKFFSPWDKSPKEGRPFKATFPDVIRFPAYIGSTPASVSTIDQKAQAKLIEHISTMAKAAREDMREDLKILGDIDLKWIDAFDRYATRARVKDLIERSDPGNFNNQYVVVCCEFGAAIGYVLQNLQPRLIWKVQYAYWDSGLVDPKTGTVIMVFHWAIKKMSEYGIDDGFAAKIKACLELLDR